MFKGYIMLYKVKVNFYPELISDLFAKLTDSTIKNQKPDGLEIIASMQRAIKTNNKTVEWYESCLCETPLKHERETIYDTYFYNFEIKLVSDDKQDIVGESFWAYMEKQ
jgi:hypothetical protein